MTIQKEVFFLQANSAGPVKSQKSDNTLAELGQGAGSAVDEACYEVVNSDEHTNSPG